MLTKESPSALIYACLCEGYAFSDQLEYRGTIWDDILHYWTETSLILLGQFLR